MKKLMIIASCGLLLLAAGCKKDEPKPDPQPQSLTANVARPTWAAPEDYDYTSSMIAVIRVDLRAQYPDQAADWQLSEQDLIAAFIGDECLGVAQPQDGLFYLYVASPTSNSEAVTLRYWSAHYKNLFEAKAAFPFENDDKLGTVAEPFTPTFVVVK